MLTFNKVGLIGIIDSATRIGIVNDSTFRNTNVIIVDSSINIVINVYVFVGFFQ